MAPAGSRESAGVCSAYAFGSTAPWSLRWEVSKKAQENSKNPHREATRSLGLRVEANWNLARVCL